MKKFLMPTVFLAVCLLGCDIADSVDTSSEISKVESSTKSPSAPLPAAEIEFCKKTFPIDTKRIHCSQLTTLDLKPLAQLKDLHHLNISHCDVDDLSPISGLRKLKTLRFNGTRVGDLSAIKNITSLEYLAFHTTTISDLSPLKNMNHLKVLDIRTTGVTELAPIGHLQNLEELKTDLYDLRATKGMTKLKKVNGQHWYYSESSITKEIEAEQAYKIKTFAFVLPGGFTLSAKNRKLVVTDSNNVSITHVFDQPIRRIFPNPSSPIVGIVTSKRAVSLDNSTRYYFAFVNKAFVNKIIDQTKSSDWIAEVDHDDDITFFHKDFWSPDGRHAAFNTSAGGRVIKTKDLYVFFKSNGRRGGFRQFEFSAMLSAVVKWISPTVLQIQHASCGDIWHRRYDLVANTLSKKKCITGGCSRYSKGRFYYSPDQIEITYDNESVDFGDSRFERTLNVARGKGSQAELMEVEVREYYKKFENAIGPCAKRVKPDLTGGFDIILTLNEREIPDVLSIEGKLYRNIPIQEDADPFLGPESIPGPATATEAFISCLTKRIKRIPLPKLIKSQPMTINMGLVINATASAPSQTRDGC